MKKLIPLCLLLILGLSFCTKKDNAVVTPKVAASDSAVIKPGAFRPYVDTFSGLLTDIFDNSYNTIDTVTDSSKLSSVYITHYSATSAVVTGEQIYTSYFDAGGNVKFSTAAYSFALNPDSPHVYNFYQDETTIGQYKMAQVVLRNDSVIVSIYNSYYCSSYSDNRIFKGKKNGR